MVGKETKGKIKMKQVSSSSKDCQEVREKKLVPTVEKPIGSSGSASVVRPLPKVKQLTKKKEVAPKAVRKGALPTVTKKVSKTGSGGNGRGKASSEKAKQNGNAKPVVKPVIKSTVAKPAVEKL